MYLYLCVCSKWHFYNGVLYQKKNENLLEILSGKNAKSHTQADTQLLSLEVIEFKEKWEDHEEKRKLKLN